MSQADLESVEEVMKVADAIFGLNGNVLVALLVGYMIQTCFKTIATL
jgi:hypothetical protein